MVRLSVAVIVMTSSRTSSLSCSRRLTGRTSISSHTHGRCLHTAELSVTNLMRWRSRQPAVPALDLSGGGVRVLNDPRSSAVIPRHLNIEVLGYAGTENFGRNHRPESDRPDRTPEIGERVDDDAVQGDPLHA